MLCLNVIAVILTLRRWRHHKQTPNRPILPRSRRGSRGGCWHHHGTPGRDRATRPRRITTCIGLDTERPYRIRPCTTIDFRGPVPAFQ
jgi:hypothetical protein